MFIGVMVAQHITLAKQKTKFSSFLYFAAQFGLFKHVSEKVKNKKQDERAGTASKLHNCRGPYLTSLCPLSLERSLFKVDRDATGIVL
jgi:hypothetical protein